MDKEWPTPKDININMMPFIIGDKNSIPEEYIQYWPLISRCKFSRSEKGQVGYLTIHESLVEPNKSQRRPGLHIESPGSLSNSYGYGYDNLCINWGGGATFGTFYDVTKQEITWNRTGGIFMASNLSDSCAVWNAGILNPEQIVDHGGNIDHLRQVLGKPKLIKKGEIWWIQDNTPHESLLLKQATPQYRQFFRIVSPELSVWYSAHSTENKIGIKPGPNTKIIHENKFATVTE